MGAMPNGGRIGAVNTPTYPMSSISGIWTPEDAAMQPVWPNDSAVRDVTYSNVAIHMHMEGSPGQSGAYNSCGRGNQAGTTSATVQVPVLSATQAKFGKTSMFFASGGCALSFPSHANYAIGTGDFVVRCWIYPTSFPSAAGIWNMGSFVPELYFDSSGTLFWYSTGPTSSAGAIVLNSWQYVEATRTSTTARIFVNGTQVGTNTNSTNYPAATFNIGGTDAYVGYIDEFQFVVGQAGHTTNYTAPTTPFADY